MDQFSEKGGHLHLHNESKKLPHWFWISAMGTCCNGYLVPKNKMIAETNWDLVSNHHFISKDLIYSKIVCHKK